MSYYDDFSELSFSEKEAYIGEHFGCMFCGNNMDKAVMEGEDAQ